MSFTIPTRRDLLRSLGGGIGMIGLRSLLADDSAAASGVPASSVKPPHFTPRAKRMIWLFMHGGPSHVDLFDPKPELSRYAGKPLPESFGEVMTRRQVATNPLLPPVIRSRPARSPIASGNTTSAAGCRPLPVISG